MFSLDTLGLFLFPPLPPAYEASDGTFWKTAGAAFLNDLIARKWNELLPVMCDCGNVRVARGALGLSQARLAREVGISQAYYSMLEGGRCRISKPMAWRLWAALCHLDAAPMKASPEILLRISGQCALISTTIEKVL